MTTRSLKVDMNDSIDVDLIKSLKEVTDKRSVVVFASTRAGEEQLIIDGYLK